MFLRKVEVPIFINKYSWIINFHRAIVNHFCENLNPKEKPENVDVPIAEEWAIFLWISD